MSDNDFVIRKMTGDAAQRQLTVTAYRKDVGEVTVTVPTSGIDGDALPAAIEHALTLKLESDEAANAD